MKAAEAMRKNIVIVEEDVSVAKASMSMRKKGEGCAIILRQGRPFGIVTERDVTWKVAGNGLKLASLEGESCMSLTSFRELSTVWKTQNVFS